VQTQEVNFASWITTALDNRFENLSSDPALQAVQLLDIKLWPVPQDESSNNFGNDHVKMLYNHFSGLLEDRVGSLDDMTREWAEFKQFVTVNMNHLPGTAVMETLYCIQAADQSILNPNVILTLSRPYVYSYTLTTKW